MQVCRVKLYTERLLKVQKLYVTHS